MSGRSSFICEWQMSADSIVCVYLTQPIGIGQWQVGEGAFPLDKVPGGADVVVPRDDPLHRIPNHVDVNGNGIVVPAMKKKQQQCIKK